MGLSYPEAHPCGPILGRCPLPCLELWSQSEILPGRGRCNICCLPLFLSETVHEVALKDKEPDTQDADEMKVSGEGMGITRAWQNCVGPC